VAVEIDRDLIAELTPKLPPNATLVSGDVLEIDLQSLISAPASGPIRVAGNLPYNISTPVLLALLRLESARSLRDATLMLQREVAARISARAGTAEYGSLSVMVQWRAEVTRLLTIPPGAFRPQPEVHSALVRLTFRPPPYALKDTGVFEEMTRAMFTRRRKALTNALTPFGAAVGLSAQDALRSAGIDPKRRPETLEIVEIARLADVFAAAKM
jgi:16S rRNA (adenine1518-N6/adenine1519-N6)-dimethyltransferase